MGINAFVALTVSKNGEKPEQALAAALVAGVILVIEVRNNPRKLSSFSDFLLSGWGGVCKFFAFDPLTVAVGSLKAAPCLCRRVNSSAHLNSSAHPRWVHHVDKLCLQS